MLITAVEVNDIPPWMFVFVLLSCNFLGFAVTGNEEQYFAFAKQYINPEWMPHSFILSDIAGTRILFNLLVGPLLQWVSFEQMAFWGRCVNFLLYALVLTNLLKKLDISNFASFFVLQVVYFGQQSLYGREWIFGSFESKTIAYVFLLHGVTLFLERSYSKCVVLAALSTCFHILVGGWFSIIIFSSLFIFDHVSRTKLLKLGLLYAILVSPLLLYLIPTYFLKNAPHIINGINLNYVYVYIRNPHHLVLFSDLADFLKHDLDGVSLTLLLYLACLLYFSKIQDAWIRRLNQLNIILFTQQIIFVGVGMFDKTGAVLKYYPYRTNALSFLLILMQIARYVKCVEWQELWQKYRHIRIIKKCAMYLDGLAVVLVLTAFAIATADNISENMAYAADSPQNVAKEELYAFVARHTQEEDMLLFYTRRDHDLSFIRRTGRELFFVDKFIPTSNDDIYEWYQRYLKKQAALDDIDYLLTLKKECHLRYVICLQPVTHNNLQLVFQNSHYFVYKLM